MDYAKALADLNKWLAYGDVASHELAAEHGEAIRSALELAMKVESGYVVVPVEPTEDMLHAAFLLNSNIVKGTITHLGSKVTEPVYKAMIQAATKGTRG